MSKSDYGQYEALNAYMQSVSLRETDIQRRLREETAKLPMAGMQVSPDQGQFMALLLRLMGARSVLEIGTFTGYSALCFAMSMPRGEGRIVCCDVSEEWTDIAREYWAEAGVHPMIDLILAPAHETLEALLLSGAEGAFDFAFIDADKANYGLYFEECLKLVRRGGLIAIDNALWSGKVADPGALDADTVAIRRLIERLHGDERVEVSFLAIGDGLYLARKR